jgi:hypothetical protein
MWSFNIRTSARPAVQVPRFGLQQARPTARRRARCHFRNWPFKNRRDAGVHSLTHLGRVARGLVACSESSYVVVLAAVYFIVLPALPWRSGPARGGPGVYPPPSAGAVPAPFRHENRAPPCDFDIE